MLSMIRLNVKYKTDQEASQMEFKQDALIRDVVSFYLSLHNNNNNKNKTTKDDKRKISMIAAKYDLPLHYPYVISNPQVDPTTPQAWIRPDAETTLHSSYLKANVCN